MKKIISLLLIVVLSLAFVVSCNNTDDSTEKADVNVAVLNGSTGFGMAYLMEQASNDSASNNYTFTVHTAPTEIQSALLNGDIDIAALSTSKASTIYNESNGAIKVIALNTLGVLYLVENGTTTINSINDLEGKTIYCPGDPSPILRSLLSKNSINATIDTTYKSPADLNKAVSSGALKDKNVIAVLPEPVLTTAMKANSKISVRLDLTEEWNKVEDTELVQGCVVARTDFINENPEAIIKFLSEYKESIEYLQENIDDAAKLVVEHGIFANENVAKIAIPKCNVTYIDGSEMKTTLNGFLSAIYSVVPSNIGGKLPNDDFYYISE